jgi:transposase
MMSDARGKTYRPWEPQHYRQEAQSPEAKLPQDALVCFVLDTVPPLDVRRFSAAYDDDTRGAPPFDPPIMVCVLLSAYCVGVCASRKIAPACERHLAFLAIVGAERPACRTSSDVRKRPLEALCAGCVEVLRLAGEAGWVQLGNVATDGTTLQGKASRHKAMR